MIRQFYLILLVQTLAIAQFSWEWHNPLPQGNRLNSVTYGNDRYVAVGDMGTIITSRDGSDWIMCNSGSMVNLNCIEYVNSIYIAVGDTGTILTSQDGVHWNKCVSGITDRLVSLAFGNAQYIIVGGNGTEKAVDSMSLTKHLTGFGMGQVP